MSKRFEANAREIREMFDDGFVRMWRMYLNGGRPSAGETQGSIRSSSPTD